MYFIHTFLLCVLYVHYDEEEDIIKLKAFAEVPELKMVLRLLVESKVSLHDSIRIAE